MHIFHLFCNNRPYQTNTILFISSSTILIYGSILICLLVVNNIHINQLSPPLNHPRLFILYHMAYLDIGYFVQRRKTNERQNVFFCPWRLTMRILLDKYINGTHYLYSNKYRHIFPNRWHGIII